MRPAVGLYHIVPSLLWLWRSSIDTGGIRPFGTSHPLGTVYPVWWWMLAFAVLAYRIRSHY
jgi:hypothetical protein